MLRRKRPKRDVEDGTEGGGGRRGRTVVTWRRRGGDGNHTEQPKARGYGDGPSRENDPSRRRHVIVLPRMLHPPKLEGMGG
ncbi:hypothetical protein Hanom_Chr13g01219301 [Helianthus anomalus]